MMMKKKVDIYWSRGTTPKILVIVFQFWFAELYMN